MANAWIKLVTKTYNNNKTKKGYTFKQAIKDSKKVYKKGGDNNEVLPPTVLEPSSPPVEAVVEEPKTVLGGKKTRKNRTVKKRGVKK